MKFLHISDTHYLNQNPGSLYGVDYDPNQVLKNFFKEHDFSPYDFIVHTGDVISDGTAADYQGIKELFERYIPESTPLYVIPGNHDRRPELAAVFPQKIRGDHYAYRVDFNNYRLIFLDTLIEGQHDGTLGAKQEEWVMEELSQPFGSGTLIFQHHPYEIGWKEGELEINVSDSYKKALAQSDVLAIFTGHLHMGQTSIVYGKPQFTANSLSFGISLRDHQVFMRNNRLGYAIVNVEENLIKYYPEIHYPTVTDFQEEVKVVDLQKGS